MAKLRAQTEVWKIKMEKAQLDKQLSITNNPANKNSTLGQLGMDINTEIINLAKSSGVQSFYLSSIDDNLSEKAQNKWSCYWYNITVNKVIKAHYWHWKRH